MIERTFQHIPGVGPWREKDLWARGIETWDDFPAAGSEACLSVKNDEVARRRIDQAREALASRDLATLAKMIPPREHWRLYPVFAEQAVYFDIEADGVGEHVPTVASVFDDRGVRSFVRGRDLDDLPEALAERKLWVSFNGSCFDVPVLKQYFEKRGIAFPEPHAHLDLRFLCRRVRLPGGLKEIEDELGLSRPPHLRGVKGWDAIGLWRTFHRTRDIEALRFLVEYNLYDSINLKALLDHAYNRAVDYLALEEPRRTIFDRAEVLYDVTKLVMAIGA
jgi:uncharacterized protein